MRVRAQIRVVALAERAIDVVIDLVVFVVVDLVVVVVVVVRFVAAGDDLGGAASLAVVVAVAVVAAAGVPPAPLPRELLCALAAKVGDERSDRRVVLALGQQPR